jgi:glycosidase
MVFNHTSTQHAWFRESLNKESPYRQFYIWRDGTPEQLPTTGAPSLAATPGAGTPRASSIICTCSPEQADLNWENPAVRAELKKVCEFWADRGVDGLRLDVINLISKDQDFPDDNTATAAASIPTGRAFTNIAGDEPRRLHPAQPDDGGRDVLDLAGELPAVCRARRARAVDDL